MLLLEKVSRTRAVASDSTEKITLIVIAAVTIASIIHAALYALDLSAQAALGYECGLRVAHGKIPFIDLFEVMSPALMYVYAIPAVFSRLVPAIHPIIVFKEFIALLAAASAIFSGLILFRAKTREQAHAFAFIIGFSLLNVFFLKEVGQREHVFLLLFMPFFLTRWMSWNKQSTNRRFSIIAGVLGGIAVCFDPIFLLILLGLELSYLLMKRRWKPFTTIEMMAMGVTFIIFILHFFILGIEYVEQYFAWAIPMELIDFKLWDGRLGYMFKTPDRRDLVYLMIVSATISFGLRRWCSLISPCLALASIGFGLMVLEGRTFTYQLMPMSYGATLSLFLVASIVANFVIKNFELKTDFVNVKTVAILSAVIVVGFVGRWVTRSQPIVSLEPLGFFGASYFNEQSSFITAVCKYTKPGDKVIILNDRVRPAYPLITQLNREPGCHIMTAFGLRMCRQLTDDKPLEADRWIPKRDRMYQQLIKDIVEGDAKVILLERDSIGNLLIDHFAMPVIDEYYADTGWLEWPDNEGKTTIEYNAFRTALQLYVRKKKVEPVPPPVPTPVVPAPVETAPAVTTPAVPPPVGTPPAATTP